MAIDRFRHNSISSPRGLFSLPPYIALLRGVNVAGHNSVKMEQLRISLAQIGFKNVQTYVQSGNIVFQASKEKPESISHQITTLFQQNFHFKPSVIVRTLQDMREVVSQNPFMKQKDIDQSKLHVTFLSKPLEKTRLAKLESLTVTRDKLLPSSREIYLYCPDGYGRSKLSNTAIEKALSVTATTRNWKTTNVLFDLASKL